MGISVGERKRNGDFCWCERGMGISVGVRKRNGDFCWCEKEGWGFLLV